MTIALQSQDPASFAALIFARKEIPGRIYVEVSSHQKATVVARSIVELSKTQIRKVPQNWMMKLLTPPRRLLPLHKTWVWVREVHDKRHSVYLGDIGLVVKHLKL